MIYVIFSAIIFGLVHPGSKFVMGHGIDLLSFCLLYVAIRLAVQIPIVLKTGAYRLISRGQVLTLLSIGIVGAILQMTEFMGIAKGLPVPIVTFLVYTHPIWTLIMGAVINGDKISPTSVSKMSLGICGSGVIALGHLSGTFNANFSQLIAPIFAGLMIALWVCLGSKAKKDGASSWTVSFYYDLFALMALLGIRSMGIMPSMSLPEIGGFLSKPENAIAISCYSIFVGLVPNLLFYKGSQSVSALSCGLILLLEPLVASLISNVAWSDPLPHFFFLGAGLVLLAGSPLENLPIRKWISGMQLARFSTVTARTALAVFLPVNSVAETVTKTLHLVEVIPAEQSDYTVSKELKAIDVASDMALTDFQGRHPKCPIKLKKSLGRGTDEDLFRRIAGLAKGANGSEMLVGMTRTSFARIAATASKGSALKAISIGSAATNLADINKNFFSIVSPWTLQWSAISSELDERKCTSRNTTGYFDKTDFLSRNFEASFEKKYGAAKSRSIAELADGGTIADSDCLFIAVNFSQAQAPLSRVAKKHLKLTIVGIGDWNYYATELNALLKNVSQSWKVSVPTGWTPKVSRESQAFAARFERAAHESTSPVAAYTYDAMTVALSSLCDGTEPRQLSPPKLKKLKLLRDYSGIAASNNFESPMHIVRF